MQETTIKKDHFIWSHDPSGYCFLKNGRIYRKINKIYRDDYSFLMDSGLYAELARRALLIAHEEAIIDIGSEPDVYKVISPEQIDFISYPYEWCFSQLKDAALVTLEIQKTALKFGMSLKDSSAFNIQFRNGRPVLIDTLSFERYKPGKPWVAYRQFCQHFIASLALMSRRDPRLILLFRTYHDGIPLDLASLLLPLRTHLSLSLFSHIHFHSGIQHFFGGRNIKTSKYSMSKFALEGLIDNLGSTIRRMKIKARKTDISGYYRHTTYTSSGMDHKKQLVSEFLDKITPKTLWDFGANTGVFSRIAAAKGIKVVSFDNDYVAVEENYLTSIKNKEMNLLSLCIDLVNPTPRLGWACEEKMSLKDRGPVDTVLALALIHHLAIGYAIPLEAIADFLGEICSFLIIEFVPKDDKRVEEMLANREDIFINYTQDNFETEFSRIFNIVSKSLIKDSSRVMYLMQKK
jgi:hypothetical protein